MYRIKKLLTGLGLCTAIILQGCGKTDGITGGSTHAAPPAYPAQQERSVVVTPTSDEKTAMQATQEVITQNARTTPAPTGAVKPTIEPITSMPQVTGQQAGSGWIVENPHTPMLRAYAIDNLWYTRTTTETVSVFAGAFKDDMNQGVVMVAYR